MQRRRKRIFSAIQQIFGQWLGRLSTKLVPQPAGSMIQAHRLSTPGLQSHQPSRVSARAQHRLSPFGGSLPIRCSAVGCWLHSEQTVDLVVAVADAAAGCIVTVAVADNGPLKAPPRKTAMVSKKSVLFRWDPNNENGATCRVLPAVAPGWFPSVAFPCCERSVSSLARINWRGWRVGKGGDAMIDRSQLFHIQRLQAFTRRA